MLKQILMKQIDHLDLDKIHQFCEPLNFGIRHIIGKLDIVNKRPVYEVSDIHVIFIEIKRIIDLDIEKKIHKFVEK